MKDLDIAILIPNFFFSWPCCVILRALYICLFCFPASPFPNQVHGGQSLWLTVSLLVAKLWLTITLYIPVYIQFHYANEFPVHQRIDGFLFTHVHPAIIWPVSWGCRIHRLLLCRGVRPPANECPGCDTKQSDGEVPAVLELWGMQSTTSLPLLPGPLWPRVVAPDRVLSMG